MSHSAQYFIWLNNISFELIEFFKYITKNNKKLTLEEFLNSKYFWQRLS